MHNHITPTICRICKENCGILVSQSENSKIDIKGNPDHPLSKGFLCFKGRHFSTLHNSSKRLRQPLFKNKGQWEPVSFADAVDIMAREFDRCRQKYGAQSVAFLKGESLKHQEIKSYMKHLAHAFGSPNYMSVGSLCHQSLAMGHGLTYGGIPKPDFKRLKSAVLWGTNVAASSQRLFIRLRKAVQKGVKLIVVDPCDTRTTQLADLHLKITPGSDGLLALAFLKAAIENRHLTANPARESGWERLEKEIDSASFASLLQPTGIGETEFFKAADLIFENRPSWNLCGVALELQPSGLQTVRAVACLQSIVDPQTAPTSGLFALNALPNTGDYPRMVEPVGHKQASLYVKQMQEAQAMFLKDAVLNDDPYPLRAMLLAGTNPALTFPDAALQRRMFGRLDFLAVADLFMTETAEMATLVLPAADHLDSLELHDYGAAGKPYLGLVRPIAQKGPGWPIWKWTFELARRLGLDAYFPWDTNEDALRYRLAGSGISLEALMDSPAATLPYQPDPAKKKTDNRIHYYSQDAEDAATTSGLPTPAAFKLPFSTNEKYPFWLSTGDRVKIFQHSQFRVSPDYLEKDAGPRVDIHGEPAAAAGINSGDRVNIVTRYGKLAVRAHVTDQVRPDCLRMTHGWNEANINEITGMEYFDPLSGFPWCRALPAQIELPGSKS